MLYPPKCQGRLPTSFLHAGSALTGQLMRRHKPQRYMPAVFALASAAMVVPFLFHLEHRDASAGACVGCMLGRGL